MNKKVSFIYRVTTLQYPSPQEKGFYVGKIRANAIYASESAQLTH